LVESKELHTKIDEILYHVKSMDGQLPWLIRSQAKTLEPLVLSYFKKRKRAAKVYLAIDGKRNISQIAKLLNIHQPNISIEIKDLESNGFIEQRKWGIYSKTAIELVLRLSDKLVKLIPELRSLEQD
jgi:predicted transcriptional regulator